ncbi:MAG TPA: metal ABC transporter ATP-binding protein [Anaeromyxobacteraceae bacterium]|nr:metal ABC transporter ATP-binding protein [Anaeromyxobacteraceae bacterium]
MSGPLVALRGASIGFGRRPILSGLDVAVAPGDFLAVVGPNGGGKTTLLRSLLGTLPLVAGRREQPRPVRVGYVPQRDQVDPVWPLTALDIVLMGRFAALGPWRRPGAADREAALRALVQVGIGETADRLYRRLSGGQKQRALIARALAAEPELLALDEPTSGMDPAAELSTMDLVRDLWRGGRLAVVMVSHRLDAVANYARALAFVDRERALFRVGTLDEMLRPEALGELYGRPVTVREENGRRFVHPLAGEGRP